MPGVSSVLGRAPIGDSASSLFTARTAFRIPATYWLPSSRDYDLHFEHLATANILHMIHVDLLHSHFPCSSRLASLVVILTFPYDRRCL
jgi:hypothetical protein